MKRRSLYNILLRVGVPLLLAVILIGAYRGTLYSFGAFVPMEKVVLKSKKVKLDGVRLIKAEIRLGTVSILAAQDEKLRVRLKGAPGTPDARMFRVSEAGGILTVTDLGEAGDEPLFGLGAFRRDLELYLPADYHESIEIESARGGFQCGNPLTLVALKMNFTSGDIRFTAPVEAETLSIRNKSGQIRLDQVAARKSARIRSASGEIEAAAVDAPAYMLIAKSGRVRVDSLAGAGLLQTGSGALDASITRLTGLLEVESGAGRVGLRLAGDLSFHLDALSEKKTVRLQGSGGQETGDRLIREAGEAPRHKIIVRSQTGGVRITRE